MRKEKNEVFEAEILDIDDDGAGIGKDKDGFIWFIKDAVTGDRVLAQAVKLKKSYGYARVVKLVRRSKMRAEILCPAALKCGGCQLQSLNYSAQLKYKENKVISSLTRIGGFDEEYIKSVCEPVMGMERPFRYRNKAVYPIGRSKDGKIIAGFYAGRTHSIIECDDCLIGIPENKAILRAVTEVMNETGAEPYDEKSGRGDVRHVLIRKGFNTGEIMVCIVMNRGAGEISDSGGFFEKGNFFKDRNSFNNGVFFKNGDSLNNGDFFKNGDSFNNGDSFDNGDLPECKNILKHDRSKVSAPSGGASGGSRDFDEQKTGEKEFLTDFTAKVCERLKAVCPALRSFSVCLNAARTNVIMGQKLINVYGPGYIEETIRVERRFDAHRPERPDRRPDGRPDADPYGQSIRFRISPLSFFQVNTIQTERLYSTVLEFAELSGSENVLDLYCGVGSISLCMAGRAGSVTGVEAAPEAIDNAGQNAAINGIDNVRFEVGRAEDIAARLAGSSDIAAGFSENGNGDAKLTEINCAAAKSAENVSASSGLSEHVTGAERNIVPSNPESGFDIIVVDPPRKGCDKKCLESIGRLRPSKVIYVSCNPATLARDLKILADYGYCPVRIRPVDMFPMTAHIETVCALSRIK